MKFWREAATLILAMRPSQMRSAIGAASAVGSSRLKDVEERPSSGYSEDYRILMLKRSQSNTFMPSKSVFPGGVLQKVDHSKGWVDLFSKITSQSLDEFSNMFHTNNLRPPIISVSRPWDVVADVAFRICAVREMFEECGLLLATRRIPELPPKGAILTGCPTWESSTVTDVDPGFLKSWRARVHENSTEFLRLCHELEAFPNVWALENWRNWLTPVFEKVESASNKPHRFDTLFYTCCLDCEKLPLAAADDEETIALEWKSPTEYLRLLENVDEKRSMAPPQVYELERMKLFPTLNQLHHYARVHGQEVMSCWMPVMKMCTDAFIIVLPGDHLYPAEPDFEGTKEVKASEPLISLSQLMAKDERKNLHRIIFKDQTFRNGRVIRNIATSLQ